MRLKKWAEAVALLEDNADSLSSSEQDAIKTLQNLWRKEKFGSSCTTSVDRMTKLLSDCDKLHGNRRDLVQASKDFRGVAKEMYATDEETFQQFAEAMKKTHGGPQLTDEQQRRREEAQERRRREAERQQQEQQERERQEQERQRQELERLRNKHDFKITRVEFIDTENDEEPMGTRQKPFRNNIHYLAPKIYYSYEGPGETVSLQVTYYHPDGTKIEGPGGNSCSTVNEITVEGGSHEGWSYQGFGNDDGDCYAAPGEYRVEIVWKGKRLWSGSFFVQGKTSNPSPRPQPHRRPDPQPQGGKSGSSSKYLIWLAVIAVFFVVGYFIWNKSQESNEPSIDYATLFKGYWNGEFQNRAATLAIDSVAGDSIFGRVCVKFKKQTDNHAVKGKAESNEEGTMLILDDVDAGKQKNDFLNGGYRLLLNGTHDQLSGSYTNYEKNESSSLTLQKSDTPDIDPSKVSSKAKKKEPKQKKTETNSQTEQPAPAAKPKPVQAEPEEEPVPTSTGFKLEKIDNIP